MADDSTDDTTDATAPEVLAPVIPWRHESELTEQEMDDMMLAAFDRAHGLRPAQAPTCTDEPQLSLVKPER